MSLSTRLIINWIYAVVNLGIGILIGIQGVKPMVFLVFGTMYWTIYLMFIHLIYSQREELTQTKSKTSKE